MFSCTALSCVESPRVQTAPRTQAWDSKGVRHETAPAPRKIQASRPVLRYEEASAKTVDYWDVLYKQLEKLGSKGVLAVTLGPVAGLAYGAVTRDNGSRFVTFLVDANASGVQMLIDQAKVVAPSASQPGKLKLTFQLPMETYKLPHAAAQREKAPRQGRSLYSPSLPEIQTGTSAPPRTALQVLASAKAA